MIGTRGDSGAYQHTQANYERIDEPVVPQANQLHRIGRDVSDRESSG